MIELKANFKNRLTKYILSTFLLFIFLSPLLFYQVNKKSITSSSIATTTTSTSKVITTTTNPLINDVTNGGNRSLLLDWLQYRKSPCFYLRDGMIIFDYGLALYIYKEFQPTSMLEYGSGLGFYLDYFYRKANTSIAVGIEPYDMQLPEFHLYKSISNKSLDRYEFYPAQFKVDLFINNNRKYKAISSSFSMYDVVISLEAAHLVNSKHHNLLADFLASHTRHWLVFSSGKQGQEAFGNVGLRNMSDWIHMFQQRSLQFMPIRTSKLRQIVDPTQPFRRKNLMLFRRRPHHHHHHQQLNYNEDMTMYERPSFSTGYYNHNKRQKLNVVKELWLSAFILQSNHFQRHCAKFNNVSQAAAAAAL